MNLHVDPRLAPTAPSARLMVAVRDIDRYLNIRELPNGPPT
jgi:hypothetical protein